jgi:hypothetical protein
MHGAMNQQASSPQMKNQTLLSKLEVTFAVIVALCCVLSLVRTVHRIGVPYQLDYTEGAVLYGGMQVAHGASPYPPVSGLPYILNTYPPVIYELVGLLVGKFGVNFTPSRVAILSSAILICVFLALLLKRWTGSWMVGLVFGFLFMTVPMVQQWLYLVRVDLIGILFTIAGLYVFVAFPKRWYLSIPLFTFSMICLYTLVAAPGACFWWLISRKEWKKAVVLAGSMAALLLLAYFWEQQRTGGWFAFYMFQSHASPYSLVQVPAMIVMVLRTHALLFVLASLAVLADFPKQVLSLPSIYLALCTITSFTAGKDGAADNHLLQLLAAVCLCAGLGYHWLRQQVFSQSFPAAQFSAAVIVGALALTSLANTPVRNLKTVEALRECDKAYAFIGSEGGDRILSDNVGVLILNNKQVFVSDPFVYRWLVWASRMPDRELEGLVRARFFDSIVLWNRADDPRVVTEFWPPSIRKAISENYQLSQQFACDAKYVYQPKVGGGGLRSGTE